MAEFPFFTPEIGDEKYQKCLNCKRNSDKDYMKRIGQDHIALERKYENECQQKAYDGYVIEFRYEFIKSGRHFHYVITVCDATSGERCPIFPGNVYKRLHWSFDDPSSLEGTYEEKLEIIRKIRDEIKEAVDDFAKEILG